MLDIEVVEQPTADGLDIVSLATMKGHLRIGASNTALDDQISDAILEAADKLHGIDGELNRMIFPCTLRRYLYGFPSSKRIRLPYPPLIGVTSISYDDGESPTPSIESTNYVVRTVDGIPEVRTLRDYSWPTLDRNPRAIAIEWRAGYEEYPPKLKRMVKILAAHYFENPAATMNDRSISMINRKVSFAMEDLRAALRIPVAQDNWVD